MPGKKVTECIPREVKLRVGLIILGALSQPLLPLHPNQRFYFSDSDPPAFGADPDTGTGTVPTESEFESTSKDFPY